MIYLLNIKDVWEKFEPDDKDFAAQLEKRNIFIDNSAEIESPVYINNGAIIGKNVIVRKDAWIGNNVRIGDDAVISSSVVIKEGTRIGTKTVISPMAKIGFNTEIGNNTYVDHHSYIGTNVVIGKHVAIGKCVSIYEDVLIEDYAKVRDNTCINRDGKVGEHHKPITFNIKGTQFRVCYWGEDRINIGCLSRTIDGWLNYSTDEEIKKLSGEHEFTDKNIREYLCYIKFIKDLHEINRENKLIT
jgi:UDP-3-O-[3-hydroxymyristoyl] glucosamine N-acyltransferase